MSSQVQVIRPVSIVDDISPLGYHRYAKQFHSAGQFIFPEKVFSPVRYYLYCRALELVLKSFLLAKGVTKSRLKRRDLGHNLESILGLAEQYGITDVLEISYQDRAIIAAANKAYLSKVFEYFDVDSALGGYRNLPDLSRMSDLVGRLLDKVQNQLVRK